MKQKSSRFSALELIPAFAKPLSILDVTSLFDEMLSQYEEEIRMRFRQLFLEDKEQDVKVWFNFDWLSLREIERLAAGEELRTPCGEVKAPGRLRLMRGYEDSKLAMVLLEFLPDEAVPQDMAFHSWFGLRFLNDCSHLNASSNEYWWVYFHALWAKETQPESTLTPCDSQLWTAALNNHEHLVEAILKHQPRIEVQAGTEKSITQTALGIAMENTGMFGAGPGFACGCHRRYRDDDFCEGEDPETWVPRAERIAERLKAAGAIDYSPLLAACRAGKTEEVEAMLKAGFPPNFSIYGHTTALCEAVQAGHEEICDLLLCHGADPNQPRPFSTSMVWGGKIYPLSLAIDHPAILKRLLEAGADPNQHRDDTDNTPVILAGGFRSAENAASVFEVVDFASIRGKHGRSGVFYLNGESLKHCRPYIPLDLLDMPDSLGMSPLLHAINFGDHDKVRLLIEMGADPARLGAIWDGEANSILRWVDTGRIPNQWLSPIQAALMTGDAVLVEYLFNLGVPTPRHSTTIVVPLLNEQEHEQLSAQLQCELETLDEEAFRIQIGRYEPGSFADERAKHCEKLLMTLLIHQPTTTMRCYPEFVKSLDLVERAQDLGLHPSMIEPFRSGKALSSATWLDLLENQLQSLDQAIAEFFHALTEEQQGSATLADSCDLLACVQHSEKALIDATRHITCKVMKPLLLVAKISEYASAEFSGGTARARRDAETSGEVGVEDFIEALGEYFKPGSTLDHGKLLQASRAAAKRLRRRAAHLAKKL